MKNSATKKIKKQNKKHSAFSGRINYFAYGSNLSTAQMWRRIPGALQGPVAHLRDYRLAFAGHSGRWGGAPATIRPEGGNAVPGVLYSVTPSQLETMDQFEGVAGGCYSRINVTVTDDKGKPHKAITYVRDHGEIESPPSVSYIATIRRGCYDHGLGVSALNDAVARAFAPRVIFVYGSLLSGFYNHTLLDTPGAAFVGEAETRGGFALYDLGSYPGMVEREDLPTETVKGELYAVDASTLREVDRLEGHPRYYTRTEIELSTGERVEGYTLDHAQVARCTRIGSGDWRAYAGKAQGAGYETEWVDYDEDNPGPFDALDDMDIIEDDDQIVIEFLTDDPANPGTERETTPPLLSDSERARFSRSR